MFSNNGASAVVTGYMALYSFAHGGEISFPRLPCCRSGSRKSSVTKSEEYILGWRASEQWHMQNVYSASMYCASQKLAVAAFLQLSTPTEQKYCIDLVPQTSLWPQLRLIFRQILDYSTARFSFFMAALCNIGQAIIFLSYGFFLLPFFLRSFFPRLISAVAD